jgi:hypothetical protein
MKPDRWNDRPKLCFLTSQSEWIRVSVGDMAHAGTNESPPPSLPRPGRGLKGQSWHRLGWQRGQRWWRSWVEKMLRSLTAIQDRVRGMSKCYGPIHSSPASKKKVPIVLETGQETSYVKVSPAMLVNRLHTEFNFKNPCCIRVIQSKRIK